jgi:hypothetical protein
MHFESLSPQQRINILGEALHLDPICVLIEILENSSYTFEEAWENYCKFLPPSTSSFWKRREELKRYWYNEKGNLLERLEKSEIIEANHFKPLTYRLTDTGKKLFVPLAYRATRLVYLVNSMSQNIKPYFFSMFRMFGSRLYSNYHYYDICMVINFLANNSDSQFTLSEISTELRIELPRITGSIRALESIRMVDVSREGRVGTKGEKKVYRIRDPENFSRTNPMSLYEEVKDWFPWFEYKDELIRIIEYMQREPKNEYSCEEIARETQTDLFTVKTCTSLLSSLGLLVSIDTRLQARANENTILADKILVNPIIQVGRNAKTYPELYDIYEEYKSNERMRKEHMRFQIDCYIKSRRIWE